MDTCCFVHYFNRNTCKGFNYLDIRNFIEANGYAPAITPYTLYEFIQGCTSPKEIDKVRFLPFPLAVTKVFHKFVARKGYRFQISS